MLTSLFPRFFPGFQVAVDTVFYIIQSINFRIYWIYRISGFTVKTICRYKRKLTENTIAEMYALVHYPFFVFVIVSN